MKDYQRQQELWINYHQKLRSEQAPPNVQLEQRLHYREFKIRQKLEDENFFKQDNHLNNDDPTSRAATNDIQTKLESDNKLFDVRIELEEPESKENDIDDEASNRIKKLLASTKNGNKMELDIQTGEKQNDDGDDNDRDEEESNTSKEYSTSSSSDSRPVLLPVTFVLPSSD